MPFRLRASPPAYNDNDVKNVLSSHQALEFNFFKFGQPDPEHNIRGIDMSLKLRMAKVRYVYTHRFTMEVGNEIKK